MYVYFLTNFEVSSIILRSFRQKEGERGVILPTPPNQLKTSQKKRTQTPVLLILRNILFALSRILNCLLNC